MDIDVVDRSEHQHMYLSKKDLRTETRVAITAHGEGDVGICFKNTLTGSKSESLRIYGIVTHATCAAGVISGDQARVIDLDVDIGADAVDYK